MITFHTNPRKREQNSLFAAHNGVGVFGDAAPKTWPFGQRVTDGFRENSERVTEHPALDCHLPFSNFPFSIRGTSFFFLDLPAAAQSETLLAARTSKTFFSSLRLSA
jgi:hypothetical protein